jgi:hypothetical protein
MFYTRPSVCLSVRPQSFPDFFPLCAQLLHWNFVHGFITMTYRSSSKMVAIDQYLEELCPLRDFTVFQTFFSLLTDIYLIFGTLLCHTKIQIKFEFGFDPLIFHKVMALGLRKKSRFISFLDFFALCLKILIFIFGTLFCNTKNSCRWFLSIWISRSSGPWT